MSLSSSPNIWKMQALFSLAWFAAKLSLKLPLLLLRIGNMNFFSEEREREFEWNLLLLHRHINFISLFLFALFLSPARSRKIEMCNVYCEKPRERRRRVFSSGFWLPRLFSAHNTSLAPPDIIDVRRRLHKLPNKTSWFSPLLFLPQKLLQKNPLGDDDDAFHLPDFSPSSFLLSF